MEQLKQLRIEKGLSQARLAARAELDPSTVNQIERGAREASPATLRKLADALDVSLVDLLEEAPKAPAPSPEEGAAQYMVSAGELARMFRNLARRGQRIVERSVREGASEELSREAADYHKEAVTLLRVKGSRDIRGKDPEELAEAVEDYEEIEARIQKMLAQDLSAGEAERAESLRFKKGKGSGYTEEYGADAS